MNSTTLSDFSLLTYGKTVCHMGRKMQIETLDARTLSKENALAIAKLLVRVWPKPGKTEEYRQQQMLDLAKNYAGPEEQAPKCFLVRDGEQVIAHATFMHRKIGTEAGELTIAGLARVCTDPDYRGQKLGEKVVRPVFNLVDEGIFPFSLFQTSPEIRPFYEKLGAVLVENPIINSFSEDLHASPFWDKIIMRYPQGGDWPEGEIDLLGPGY